MKKKILQEKRKSDVQDLVTLVQEKKMEGLKTKAELRSGRTANLKKVAHLRRDIAQLMTLIKEKEILEKEKKL